MIRLQEPDQLKPTEFAPAMDEGTGILPGLPPVAGKPVHLTFDGGRMTSDAGILLLAAIEQRLGIAERLADCIEDWRDPDRVLHGLAEMIRFDDTEDRVHGGQQLALFNAHYDSRCFLPIHIYEA